MPDIKPKFQPLPAESGDGWCINVTWPNGKTEELAGFINQYHALDWINRNSENWIADKILNDPDY